MQPFLANFPAFCIAFAFGFTGHFSWTFSNTAGVSSKRNRTRALVRFAAVSGIGLSMNAAIVFMIVNVSGLPYLYAVALMISVVPVTLFFLSRQWAFA
jgi:putative flippase GtrA